MLPHIKDILDTGIDSLKIEGRMKSEHYVAAVGIAYRTEIDRYYQEENYTEPLAQSLGQLEKVTYRPYTTGFNYGSPHMEGQSATKSEYISKWDYIAKVTELTDKENLAWVKEFNPFATGDDIEVLNTDGSNYDVKLVSITDEDGENVEIAKLPKQRLLVEFDKPVSKFSILRKNTSK